MVLTKPVTSTVMKKQSAMFVSCTSNFQFSEFIHLYWNLLVNWLKFQKCKIYSFDHDYILMSFNSERWFSNQYRRDSRLRRIDDEVELIMLIDPQDEFDDSAFDPTESTTEEEKVIFALIAALQNLKNKITEPDFCQKDDGQVELIDTRWKSDNNSNEW